MRESTAGAVRGGKLATTIRDVARYARVSVASVSRAINGTGGLSEATRRRILSAARQLQYAPNGAARSLITRRTNTVGILLPDMHGEFFSELIRGIDIAARARGLHLLVSSSHGGAVESALALRAMHGRVDGMLVLSPQADADFLEENLPQGTPVVLMNRPAGGARRPTVSIDNYGGSVAMVRHLVGRGHRRIALIAGPEDNCEAQERTRGYREALARLLPSREPIILPGDFTEESGWRAGQQVLAMRERPTAIFASNDMMAIGCITALDQGGLSVPKDVAIAGYDDIPIARYVTPALTSVRVRITDLGRIALERLAAGIDNPDDTQALDQVLPTELIVRRSCGLHRTEVTRRGLVRVASRSVAADDEPAANE